MDPHSVLGVSPAADQEEVGRAYRDLAKRFHPDRRPGDADAAEQMATINAAYSMLKDGLTAEAARGRPPREAAPGRPAEPRNGDGVTDQRVRKALGPELLSALRPREKVHVVTDASTWDSPRVRVVVTDTRLVWLLADAPVERVRSLDWRKIASVDGRVRGRLRKTGELRVQPKVGKRLTFAELEPRALELLIGRIPT